MYDDHMNILPMQVGILLYKLKVVGFRKRSTPLQAHHLFSVSPPIGKLVFRLAGIYSTNIEYLVLVPYADRDKGGIYDDL